MRPADLIRQEKKDEIMERMMKKMGKKEKQSAIWISSLYFLYGAACCFLYYHMCLPAKGRYHSDLPAHIQSGMNGEAYSLLEILYKYICKAGIGSKVIPLLLTGLTLAAVYLSYKLMQQIVPDGNPLVLQLLAFAANLEMPLYLPFLHKYRNMGLQTGSMWHNDTYLGMRVFGLIVLILYFRHQESYKETWKGRQWIAFAAAFFLANFMKPNFLLCFAPVMGILLLRDLIKSRGRDFGAIFWFGLAVIPSLSILIFQSIRLFGEGTNGGSIALSFAYILRLRNEHPICSVLQSAAFPFAVLAFQWRELKKDRIYATSWMIWLCGFLEFLFLNQTGECQNDGNLTWGYSFCLTLIFAVSAAVLYRSFLRERREQTSCRPKAMQEGCADAKRSDARQMQAGTLICTGLLIWHLLCGLRFFAELLCGLPYAR